MTGPRRWHSHSYNYGDVVLTHRHDGDQAPHEHDSVVWTVDGIRSTLDGHPTPREATPLDDHRVQARTREWAPQRGRRG